MAFGYFLMIEIRLVQGLVSHNSGVDIIKFNQNRRNSM